MTTEQDGGKSAMSDELGPLPEPDLLVDCAQGCVRGWTKTTLADVLRLAAFGAWAAREFRASLSDVDGGSAQEAMERLGVIEKHEAPEPCGDGCVCAEYGEFPHDCYRFAPGVARLLRHWPNVRGNADPTAPRTPE